MAKINKIKIVFIILMFFFLFSSTVPVSAQTTTTTATITLATNSARLRDTGLSFSLFIYTLISIVYIMTIYLAVGVKSEFQLFLFIGFFIFGGVLGGILANYETGLVLAIILSLVFW